MAASRGDTSIASTVRASAAERPPTVETAECSGPLAAEWKTGGEAGLQAVFSRLAEEIGGREWRAFSANELTRAAWSFVRVGLHSGVRTVHQHVKRMLLDERATRARADGGERANRADGSTFPLAKTFATGQGMLGMQGRGHMQGGEDRLKWAEVMKVELEVLERKRRMLVADGKATAQCGPVRGEVGLGAWGWDGASLSLLAWTCAVVEASDMEVLSLIEEKVKRGAVACTFAPRDLAMLAWSHIACGRADEGYLETLTGPLQPQLGVCSLESLTQLAQVVLATTTQSQRAKALRDESSFFRRLRCELRRRRGVARDAIDDVASVAPSHGVVGDAVGDATVPGPSHSVAGLVINDVSRSGPPHGVADDAVGCGGRTQADRLPHKLADRTSQKLVHAMSGLQRSVSQALERLGVKHALEQPVLEGAYYIDIVVVADEGAEDEERTPRLIAIEVDGPSHYVNANMLPPVLHPLDRNQRDASSYSDPTMLPPAQDRDRGVSVLNRTDRTQPLAYLNSATLLKRRCACSLPPSPPPTLSFSFSLSISLCAFVHGQTQVGWKGGVSRDQHCFAGDWTDCFY